MTSGFQVGLTKLRVLIWTAAVVSSKLPPYLAVATNTSRSRIPHCSSTTFCAHPLCRSPVATMFSRARGLLQARAGHGRPVAGKQRIAIIARNYAAASSNETDPHTPRRKKDGERSRPAQRAPSEGTLIRRVTSKKIADHERFEIQAQPVENEQTKQTKSQESRIIPLEERNGVEKALDKQKSKSGHQARPVPETTPEVRSTIISGRFAFGTVATSRPRDTSIEDLIKDIKSLPSTRIRGTEENPTTLVLLLTPGLARYALDSKLSEAVYKRFNVPIKQGVRIHITSAIVDRLPTGLGEPEGSEGMAYMLFRNPPASEAGDKTLFQDSAQKPGSLTFRVPKYKPKHPSPVVEYELQLPLSQTVFTTGLVSTMIHREYAMEPTRRLLKLVNEQNLESQTLQLPATSENLGTHSIAMPLVPLTPFRKINYVMGNIIRKLSSQPTAMLQALPASEIKQTEPPEAADSDMPASQELEDSVSRYFEALDLQPETVSVWALVMPRPARNTKKLQRLCVDRLLSADDKAITSAWHSESEAATLMARATNNAIRLMTPNGARLIKVLSGGGGWGKKAGLLSLDPDVQYSTRELRQDEGWTFDFDGVDDGSGATAEAQRNQALGQIVKEGESIMFLLAPKLGNLPDSAQEHDVSTNQRIQDNNLSKLLDLTFGAIPSSIDLVPQDVASDADVAVVHHYPGRFGMLSEGGLALTVKKTQGTTGQTKLDVPFGKFVFHQYNDFYFPRLPSAARYAEMFPASAVAYQAGAKQRTHVTEQVKQDIEPVRTEPSSEPTEPTDVFESFAEYNESEDPQTPSVDHRIGPDSLLTPQ